MAHRPTMQPGMDRRVAQEYLPEGITSRRETIAAMFGFRRRRRARLRARPFPDGWNAVMERNVPYLRYLTPEERPELRGDIQVFLAEKRFEGCGGLKMTDEIRVTIAAQACLLLLHRDNDDYPRLRSILVYPHHYFAPAYAEGPAGHVVEALQDRLGESWSHGAVVLAWDSVRQGAAVIHDGHNLVLHEFAHQLDAENEYADGIPILPRTSMFGPWARILGREYHDLVARVARDRPTDIDPYGATNPAEFFAVVTEEFFERPIEMQAQHRELYEELRLFYRQDPAERVRAVGAVPESGERFPLYPP